MRPTLPCLAVALLAEWLVACERRLSPAPAYVGTATEVGHVQIDTGAAAPPGAVNVQSWDTNRPRGNVRATVVPAGERRYRVALPACTLEFEMHAPPDESNGNLVSSPQQVCDLDIDHYRGAMVVSGTVTLDRSSRALRIYVSGNNNQTSPHASWSLTYDARPE